MSSNSHKCAHAPCNCVVAEGEKYCSNYCKEAGVEVELACDCNHPNCGIDLPK